MAVVAVVGTLATCSAARVEHDLAEQSRTELRAAGLNADVELDGRDAVVRAGAGGAGDVERAAAVVAALPGVRTVRVGGATPSPGPDASGGPAAPSPTPDAAAGDSGDAPDLVIRFGSGDADLGAGERASLDELADRLSRDEDLRVRVAGHADGSGREPANLVLSRDRANAVTDYLVAAGVSAARVTTEAYGDSRPVAGNKTQRERALNRRVEIVLQEGNR